MAGAAHHLKIKVQLLCGDEIAMGPGKADLLDAIAREGSISGAGRALGMSYRRTWLLVDAMNRCWAKPLVATTPGKAVAGAVVTPMGKAVLRQYRAMQQAAEDSGAAEWQALEALLLPQPKPSQKGE